MNNYLTNAHSFLHLRHRRRKKYSGLIQAVLLLVLCWFITPLYAASQPPKVLSVKAPASADVGKLFEIEIKAQDDKALAYIEVNFGGKTSRIRIQGKKSFSKIIKLKSIKSGRLTIKVTAVNKKKAKSKPYAKTINIQASKKTTKKKANNPVKSKAVTTSQANTRTNSLPAKNKLMGKTAHRKVPQQSNTLKPGKQPLPVKPSTKPVKSPEQLKLSKKTTREQTKPAQLAILGMKPLKQKGIEHKQTRISSKFSATQKADKKADLFVKKNPLPKNNIKSVSKTATQGKPVKQFGLAKEKRRLPSDKYKKYSDKRTSARLAIFGSKIPVVKEPGTKAQPGDAENESENPETNLLDISINVSPLRWTGERGEEISNSADTSNLLDISINVSPLRWTGERGTEITNSMETVDLLDITINVSPLRWTGER